jgi:hypothetical protein
MNLVIIFPALYKNSAAGTKIPLDRWASNVAERIFTVTNHCRRLRHSLLRANQARKPLAEKQIAELTAFIDKITQGEVPKDGDVTEATPAPTVSGGDVSSSGDEKKANAKDGNEDHTEDDSEHVGLTSACARRSTKQARTLKPQHSFVSVDLEGFPNLLREFKEQKGYSPTVPYDGEYAPGPATKDMLQEIQKKLAVKERGHEEPRSCNQGASCHGAVSSSCSQAACSFCQA